MNVSPTVSLLALPLPNLPPTPPPTSASTSPFDCRTINSEKEGAKSASTQNDASSSVAQSFTGYSTASASFSSSSSSGASCSSSPHSPATATADDTVSTATSLTCAAEKWSGKPLIKVSPTSSPERSMSPLAAPNKRSLSPLAPVASTSAATANVIQGSPLKIRLELSSPERGELTTTINVPNSPAHSGAVKPCDEYAAAIASVIANMKHESGGEPPAKTELTSLSEVLAKVPQLPSPRQSNDNSALYTAIRQQQLHHQQQQQQLQQQPQQQKSAPTRGARKLKIYTLEEKLDIVDFALAIGNRAAGREYGVAESSIREWRKNEKKYRQNVASNVDAQRIEVACPWVIEEIDAKLLKFVDREKDNNLDWYGIRDQAQEFWLEIYNGGRLDGTHFTVSSISFTMGWVARFMERHAGTVANIPKPVVATTTALNNTINNNSSHSMNSSQQQHYQNGAITMVSRVELRANATAAKVSGVKRHAYNDQSGHTPLGILFRNGTVDVNPHGISHVNHVNNANGNVKRVKKSMTPKKPIGESFAALNFLAPSTSQQQSQKQQDQQLQCSVSGGASSRRKCHPPRRLPPSAAEIEVAQNLSAPVKSAQVSSPVAPNASAGNAANLAAMANFAALLMGGKFQPPANVNSAANLQKVNTANSQDKSQTAPNLNVLARLFANSIAPANSNDTPANSTPITANCANMNAMTSMFNLSPNAIRSANANANSTANNVSANANANINAAAAFAAMQFLQNMQNIIANSGNANANANFNVKTEAD